ncbi:hypothetical protein [Streptomyces sp. NPDC003023]|uniref:SCO2400 family protein n=1 Tax=Streptomyces sp. NPDC003023 TaxID=3364675 RepID=UPI0036911008
MDYCSTCRRHLNGALVCPGCGAYAPDIAPTVPTARHSAPAGAGAGAVAWEPQGTRHTPAPLEASAAQAPHGAGAAVAATPAAAAPAERGRAARRRQLARFKKNKRRAAAGTMIALVGGALTVAALPTEADDRSRTEAATTPDATVADDHPAHRPTGKVAEPVKRASAPAPRASAPAVPRQRTSADTAAVAADPAGTARTTRFAPAVSEAPASEAPAATSPTAAPSTAPTGQPPAAATGTSGSSGSSDSSGSSGSVADQPQTQPGGTASTSPTEVCLLVLCLGG